MSRLLVLPARQLLGFPADMRAASSSSAVVEGAGGGSADILAAAIDDQRCDGGVNQKKRGLELGLYKATGWAAYPRPSQSALRDGDAYTAVVHLSRLSAVIVL
jgi:hypothetical protein